MSYTRWRTILLAQFKGSPYKSGLLGILAVVLLVLVGRQLWGGPETATAAPSLISIAPAVALLPEPRLTPARSLRVPPLDLPEVLMRDLFKADWLASGRAPRAQPTTQVGEGGSTTEAAPVLVLELTLTEAADNTQHCAVINGRTVRVGDDLGGFMVESISPGEVTLTGGGTERVVLRMN